ncbi:MAG: hypothetical protein LBB86_10615 [Oscillospiraceae bacterium]|jgi:transglutaminase-like putative cysteine protease|nr:hypothetical protein [Oscillospiraceae bacterium]
MRTIANRFRDVIRDNGLTALLAAMLAFGLSLTMCGTLAIQAPPGLMALICAGCAALAILFMMHWAVRSVGWAVIASIAAAFIIRTEPFPWLVQAVSDAMIGNMATLSLRAEVVRLIITLGLSLFCLIANRRREGFYPSLSLACVIALWSWVSGADENPWLFTPVLFALVALYARSRCEQTGAMRVASMAALAVVAALVLLPSGDILNDQLASLAERVRRVAYDYLFYNEPRTIYSIQYDGFQPLGARLGGSIANPSDREVMRVDTTRTLLLRGVTKDTYTGASWTDQALSSRRYLYIDPRWRSIRDNLMDVGRPLDRLRDSAMFEPITATVTMLDESMTTLFVPHRLTALSTPVDMVLYFNSTGEVFATRNLVVGDEYTLRAPVLDLDDPRLPALAQAAAESGAPDWDNVVLEAYRALPQSVSSDVFQLTNEITDGAATQLGKLIAIRDYLKQFKYTLTPSKTPPANRDFVSFFLLDGKEGYCTYFASAMAVMARIADIPARYVEGYVARPDAGGTVLVTGMNAHAWVEAYLPGLGWISVDATPGIPPNESPDQSGDPPPENPDDPTPKPGESETNNTSSPNEHTPSPEPFDNPADAAPTPTPTRPVLPDSTEQPNAEPDQEPEAQGEEDPPRRRPWWPWLLAAMIAAGVAARAVWVDPAMAARRRKGLDEQLLTWYQAALALLAACGAAAEPYDTPLTLSRRTPSLMPLFNAVAALAYDNHVPDTQEVAAASRAYRETIGKAPIRVRVCVWFDRMLHGVGNVRKVP